MPENTCPYKWSYNSTYNWWRGPPYKFYHGFIIPSLDTIQQFSSWWTHLKMVFGASREMLIFKAPKKHTLWPLWHLANWGMRIAAP